MVYKCKLYSFKTPSLVQTAIHSKPSQPLEMRAFLWTCLFLVGSSVAQKKKPEISDGPRGGGAVFKKCGGLFGGSIGGDDRCYDVVVTKLQVQIGPDGTNDDVTAKICSDDKKTCCETPALSSAFSDDWSKNDLETWSKSSFGPCKNKKFTIKKGLEVTLNKKGTDTLGVTSLFVEAETLDKGNKIEPERFECGRYNIGGAAGAKNATSAHSKFCKTSPYTYERVSQINVTIGPDGTDDNVKIDMCSDVNGVCCQTKLSSLLSDDWSKNSNEIWKEGDLGKCKTVQYKVNKVIPNGGPRFTLSKDGKDDLTVNKIQIETVDVHGTKFKYDCGDFKLQSQGQKCVPGVNCSVTKNCKKTTLKPAPVGGTTVRPGVTTRRSERIATSTTSTSTSKPTTTRPPFRSGSGK